MDHNIIASIDGTFAYLKKSFVEKSHPTISERIQLLKKVKNSVLQHEQDLYLGLNQDYSYRSEYDSMIADLVPTVSAINYTIKNLKKWTRPSKRHAGLLLYPSTVRVMYQPVGVVGIIVPWNFPIFLCIVPIISALAAGNKVMVKMSEFTPHTNKAIQKVFANFSEHVVIFEGEVEASTHFSSLKFDHLFFTGSTQIGRLVAQAAAANLTPVTLELGGKSPVIIDEKVSWDYMINAILFGKVINAGQICVSPDYIFVPKGKKAQFVNDFTKKFNEYYTENESSYRYSCILNMGHYNRLQSYIQDVVVNGGTVHYIKDKKDNDPENLMYPILLTEVTAEMKVMKEEIFGSLLPVMEYDSLDDVITYINKGARPLALYIMSDRSEIIDKVLKQTHSGGVCVNDTIIHVSAEDAPFGGVGDSGIGHYHGIEGFKTFSHAKTIVTSPTWLPKHHLILKYKDYIANIFRKLFLR